MAETESGIITVEDNIRYYLAFGGGLEELENKDVLQKELAEQHNVSPQKVSDLVKEVKDLLKGSRAPVKHNIPVEQPAEPPKPVSKMALDEDYVDDEEELVLSQEAATLQGLLENTEGVSKRQIQRIIAFFESNPVYKDPAALHGLLLAQKVNRNGADLVVYSYTTNVPREQIQFPVASTGAMQGPPPQFSPQQIQYPYHAQATPPAQDGANDLTPNQLDAQLTREMTRLYKTMQMNQLRQTVEGKQNQGGSMGELASVISAISTTQPNWGDTFVQLIAALQNQNGGAQIAQVQALQEKLAESNARFMDVQLSKLRDDIQQSHYDPMASFATNVHRLRELGIIGEMGGGGTGQTLNADIEKLRIAQQSMNNQHNIELTKLQMAHADKKDKQQMLTELSTLVGSTVTSLNEGRIGGAVADRIAPGGAQQQTPDMSQLTAEQLANYQAELSAYGERVGQTQQAVQQERARRQQVAETQQPQPAPTPEPQTETTETPVTPVNPDEKRIFS